MQSFGRYQEVCRVIDNELIIAKASRIDHYIHIVRQKIGGRLASFLASRDCQQLVVFIFQLAVQNCVDIAAHIVSEKGYGVPGSVNELFYMLEEKGHLSREMTEKMVAAVGFRNLIVHEYGRIDLERMYEIASKDIEDLREYLKELFEAFHIVPTEGRI